MRNGFKVLDTDAHQMEPASMWRDYIDPAFADHAPAPGDYGDGRKGMMVEGEPITNQHGAYPMDAKEFLDAAGRAMKRFSRARDAGYSAAARLEDMDEQGVDAQVIYPTVGGQILGVGAAATAVGTPTWVEAISPDAAGPRVHHEAHVVQVVNPPLPEVGVLVHT